MSEKKEKVEEIVNEDLKESETSAESVTPAEVVTESAGEMVAEEKPILKVRKEKKVKVAEPAADAVKAAAAGT